MNPTAQLFFFFLFEGLVCEVLPAPAYLHAIYNTMIRALVVSTVGQNQCLTSQIGKTLEYQKILIKKKVYQLN